MLASTTYRRICLLAMLAVALLLAGGADTVKLPVQAAYVTAIIAVLTPIANALVTKPGASGTLKSVVSIVLAGLGAVGAKVAGVSGVTSGWEILGVFAAASVAAGGLKFAWLNTIEDWIRSATNFIGLGSAQPHQGDTPPPAALPKA